MGTCDVVGFAYPIEFVNLGTYLTWTHICLAWIDIHIRSNVSQMGTYDHGQMFALVDVRIQSNVQQLTYFLVTYVRDIGFANACDVLFRRILASNQVCKSFSRLIVVWMRSCL